MKVVDIGNNINYGGGVCHSCSFTGIVIEATEDEIAALNENILYNEVIVSRVPDAKRKKEPNKRIADRDLLYASTGASSCDGTTAIATPRNGGKRK